MWWMIQDAIYTCHHFFHHPIAIGIILAACVTMIYAWKRKLTFLLGLFKLQLDAILIAHWFVTYRRTIQIDQCKKTTLELASSLSYATSHKHIILSPRFRILFRENRCLTILLSFWPLLLDKGPKIGNLYGNTRRQHCTISFNQIKKFVENIGCCCLVPA